MKHTSGTWRQKIAADKTLLIVDQSDAFVASVGYYDKKNAASYAALIIAAPLMRKALEAVKRARNIKDAGRADDAMSDADILIEEALEAAAART